MQHIPALNSVQTAQYLSLHHPFPLKLTHSCFSPHAHNFKLYGLDRQRKENIGAGSRGREERRPGRTEKMWSALGLAKTGGCVALLHLWPALDCIRVTDWPWNELRLIRYDRDALGCSGSYYVIRACVDTGFCWLCLVQGQIEKNEWIQLLFDCLILLCIVELLFFPIGTTCTEDICLLARAERTEQYVEWQRVKHTCRAIDHHLQHIGHRATVYRVFIVLCLGLVLHMQHDFQSVPSSPAELFAFTGPWQCFTLFTLLEVMGTLCWRQGPHLYHYEVQSHCITSPGDVGGLGRPWGRGEEGGGWIVLDGKGL